MSLWVFILEGNESYCFPGPQKSQLKYYRTLETFAKILRR